MDNTMQEFTTPMMKQYMEIKSKYQDSLLFYRMGDFYELFLDDAHIGAQVLNITLTSRPKGKDGRIPMAGVPYHAVDSYLSKLVKAGYKVAICEQLSPPNKYGIIERDVIRIVTPGTMLDEKALDKKENNYIINIAVEDNSLAISVADLSTGYFATTLKQFEDLEQTLKNELSKIHPTECILAEELYNDGALIKILKSEKDLNIYPFLEIDNFCNDSLNFLKDHFGLSSLHGFDVEDKPLLLNSCAALLGYLKQTQKSGISHIKKVVTLGDDEYVSLDRSTIINLELFSTIREHDSKGTLLNVLDQTVTAMGGRMLKSWLSKPLTSEKEINKRYDAIEIFISDPEQRDFLRESLKEIPDLERILSRLSVGLGNARDLINLMSALQVIANTKKSLQKNSTALLEEISKKITPEIDEVIGIINQNIKDEPPIDLKIGGLIKEGISDKLDNLRQRVGNSKKWIAELETKERERTGIGSLKVRFNKVFGFYIEISKSNLSSVPSDYMRKQTLVNGERFITPELKEQEEVILTAEETINNLEYELYQKVLSQVLDKTFSIQEAAAAIATLDCVLNFAFLAEKNNYIRPQLIRNGQIKISGGRHPVVEKLLDKTQFVPNDTTIGDNSGYLHLITGPNMAGKSVYIRQVAQIVLMAQIGCFIPCDSAEISLVDRIFVRSGASDVITSGLSTFMVEMVETAYILNHATENSLIVMDEIGRGTSTYDGISIAWAIAEYLVSHFDTPPKTLFATHYHELQNLEEKFPEKIKNFSMAVSENNGSPIFLHTVIPGRASSSFGVAVAKLAGVPLEVINTAEQKLQTLENRSEPIPTIDLPAVDLLSQILIKELESLDIHQMTPLEAINKLAEIKNKLNLLKIDPNPQFDIN